jgi:integrase
MSQQNGKDFLATQRDRYFKTGRKSLSETDINKLLSVITDLQHSALIMLALSTGIRRGDIVRIKHNDFDYETGKLIFYESKKKRNHTVYVPLNVANVIQMIKKANKGETYIFTGGSDKKHGKGHLSDRSAYNILAKYLEKAGLEKRPFHALRSTCIKMCQKRGWKPEETAELVGDTITVIQEHYLVPSDQDMKEVTQERAIL